jgi:hypothetical protein
MNQNANRRPRNRHPGGAPGDLGGQPDEFEVWTDILLNGTVSFLLELDQERGRVGASLHRLADRVVAGDPIRPVRSTDVEVMTKVCCVVADWIRSPLTTTGDAARPKALSLTNGDPSLSQLLEKQFTKKDIPKAVKWMERAKVVKRLTSGKFVLTRNANLVMIDPSITLAVERFATHATRLLWSGLANFRSTDTRMRNLERSAHITNLPVKFIPVFLELAKQLGQEFLDGIDAYLEDHADANSADATVEAGMHIYTYYGSPTTGDLGGRADGSPSDSMSEAGLSLQKLPRLLARGRSGARKAPIPAKEPRGRQKRGAA